MPPQFSLYTNILWNRWQSYALRVWQKLRRVHIHKVLSQYERYAEIFFAATQKLVYFIWRNIHVWWNFVQTHLKSLLLPFYWMLLKCCRHCCLIWALGWSSVVKSFWTGQHDKDRYCRESRLRLKQIIAKKRYKLFAYTVIIDQGTPAAHFYAVFIFKNTRIRYDALLLGPCIHKPESDELASSVGLCQIDQNVIVLTFVF